MVTGEFLKPWSRGAILIFSLCRLVDNFGPNFSIQEGLKSKNPHLPPLTCSIVKLLWLDILIVDLLRLMWVVSFIRSEIGHLLAVVDETGKVHTWLSKCIRICSGAHMGIRVCHILPTRWCGMVLILPKIEPLHVVQLWIVAIKLSKKLISENYFAHEVYSTLMLLL